MRSWEELEKACSTCKHCKLWTTRTNVVIGAGNKKSDIMFIGEGPGQQEDLQGIPFVGAAGQLLDNIFKAVQLDRSQFYITNIVKCRPPYNRDPENDEKETCITFLRYQFLLIRPKIIVCLGRISAQMIIDPDFKITRDRGKWYDKKNCIMMATYHPSALLRDDTKKRPTLDDFKEIKRKYEELRENSIE